MSKNETGRESPRTKLRRVLRFMKKTLKKFAAVGLTLTSVVGLVACGPKNNTTDNKKETVDWASVEKPGKFTVMVDGTVVKETNGAAAFYKYYKELTGLDIEWIRPDHSSYADSVKNTFASGDLPDVVLLNSDYLANFASNGYLWDMTDAWEQSATKNSGRLTDMADAKNSGRLIKTADNVLNALQVAGLDGQKRMYGFSPYRGNGCCTYVKASALKAAGLDPDKVANETMTYDQYYDMLKKIQAASSNKNYVISTSGFVAGGNKPEAPYTNYLPEFYQDAQFTFYLKDGKYVDGFSEEAMKKAMDRLKTAIDDKILDPATQNASTKEARNKFTNKDANLASSVFTYWAGTWADTLKTQLEAKGLDSELIAINPIKELGTYVERIAPAWCITTHAENPEGIFKYFIDTMLDGGDVQTAWEYGAKGTHWDTKAESVTVKGKEDKPTEYKEGEFHMLPSPEKPTGLMKKNHIDPILALATFKNGTDPGAKAITDVAKTNGEFFANNSTVAVAVPYTEEMADNISDINKQRNIIVSKVANGELSAADGIKEYQSKVGNKVDEVLKSLNK